MTEMADTANLGRPTLRGVRKCPKCGTLNGTRGFSCKNVDCQFPFKVPKEKMASGPEIDVAKLVCKNDLQIYSVKLVESNDSLRCFVHLPVIEGIESLQDEAEAKLIKQSTAMCYGSTCRKTSEDEGTITLNLSPCTHTHFIVNCSLETQPLPIKKCVVKVMPLSEEFRQEIYTMLAETEEHLVQRVTKNTFVVKCSPQIEHPLGFLHFSVFQPARNSQKFRMLCDCHSELTKPYLPKERLLCFHFYLCVCGIASDVKLLEEFTPLMKCVLTIKSPDTYDPRRPDNDFYVDFKYLKSFFSDVVYTPCKKKKIDNQIIQWRNQYRGNHIPKDAQHLFGLTYLEKDTCDVTVTEENRPTKSMRKDNALPKPTTPGLPTTDFEEWLASVTERINQTMHYQFSGNPEPLLFHVPQKFFDILQQRISAGSKKKRLPNTVVAFTRKDALPVGVFSKYTWHITNVLHLKCIFDTKYVPLEVTQTFIENKDGTYTLTNPLEGEAAKLAENYQKTQNKALIKPLELKTFLKVGNMSIDQKEPTPFIIEWIPDILPKTQVGELKIKFEYGHQRNGVIENRDRIQPNTENTDIRRKKQ